MKRVLVISPSTAGRGEPDRLAVIRAGHLAQAHVGPDIELDFRPARLAPAQWDTSPELMLADLALFEAGLDAEQEGYDAVCVETVSDSGVDYLRSMLNIPVLGPGKASYLMALMLGNRFSILTAYGGWRLLYERRLREYGLSDRCASIRALDMRPEEINFANLFGGKEDRFFPQLLEQGLRCIEEDGADVIVIGSTTMYQAAPLLAEQLPVPVINPAALVFKMVELMLDLGLTHSRAAYATPVALASDVVHSMLDAAQPGRS